MNYSIKFTVLKNSYMRSSSWSSNISDFTWINPDYYVSNLLWYVIINIKVRFENIHEINMILLCKKFYTFLQSQIMNTSFLYIYPPPITAPVIQPNKNSNTGNWL